MVGHRVIKRFKDGNSLELKINIPKWITKHTYTIKIFNYGEKKKRIIAKCTKIKLNPIGSEIQFKHLISLKHLRKRLLP